MVSGGRTLGQERMLRIGGELFRVGHWLLRMKHQAQVGSVWLSVELGPLLRHSRVHAHSLANTGPAALSCAWERFEAHTSKCPEGDRKPRHVATQTNYA